MFPYLLYLQYLTFTNFGKGNAADFTTEHCFAMKSVSLLRFCNRVCGASQTSKQEASEIIAYFDTIPFAWFSHNADAVQSNILEQAGLHPITSFPAMILPLDYLKTANYKPGVTVQEITHASGMALWLSIIIGSYTITAPLEFEKFINVLKLRTLQTGIRFYCGFYEGIPVAASVLIYHGDTVGLHWVGTLPEYRGKGIGYAVSYQPLLDAQKGGCKNALLLSSPMGRSVYESIGFKEYAHYTVYGK